MKTALMLLFTLCTGSSLCIALACEDSATKFMASIELVLASFAFVITYKLIKVWDQIS